MRFAPSLLGAAIVIAAAACSDATGPGSGSHTLLFAELDTGAFYAVYTMQTDGTGLRRVSPRSMSAPQAAWSPDGQRIAYTQRFPDISVWVASAAEYSASKLTLPQPGTGFGTPWVSSWSPTGAILVYDGRDLGMISLTGQFHPVTSDHNTSFGVVSPDGTHIVCARSVTVAPQRTTQEIGVMNADGTELLMITNEFNGAFQPAWSPDGRQIAYVTPNGNGGAALYVISTLGGPSTQLTSGTQFDMSPSWSPDGKRIAFLRGPPGAVDIYLMNADGTGLAALTTDGLPKTFVKWRP